MTDGEGRYRLVVPSPGIYNVWLKKCSRPGMTAVADDGILVEAGKRADSKLRLVRGRIVVGKVSNENGEPIEHLVVSCYSPARPFAGGVESVRTKSGGSFEFVLPPGRAYVYVLHENERLSKNPLIGRLWADAHVRIPSEGKIHPIELVVNPSQPASGDLDWVTRTTPGTRIVRREGNQHITGTVVDQVGTPIRSAKVFSYDGPLVPTNDEGEFRVDTEKNTQRVMHAVAPGYHVWTGLPTSGDVLKIVLESKTPLVDRPPTAAGEAPLALTQRASTAADVEVKYPYCVVNLDDLQSRSLTAAIATFNAEAKQSPIGRMEAPVSPEEILEAITTFVEQQHVPDPVKDVLRQVTTSMTLPANCYLRRFTRFDDEQRMNGVWWVRLVVEAPSLPVYSVPIRTQQVYSRPYTQMERQQNAEQGVMVVNRFTSYFEELPNVRLLEAFPQDAMERLISQADAGLRTNDLEMLASLFEWKDVSHGTRKFVESELTMLTRSTIHSIKITPRNFRGRLIHWSAYQHYQPNLPVVGYLDIEYAPAGNTSGLKKTLSLEMGKAGNELRLVNYVAYGERELPETPILGMSTSGRLEPLADGTFLVTSLTTNPGTL